MDQCNKGYLSVEWRFLLKISPYGSGNDPPPGSGANILITVLKHIFRLTQQLWKSRNEVLHWSNEADLRQGHSRFRSARKSNQRDTWTSRTTTSRRSSLLWPTSQIYTQEKHGYTMPMAAVHDYVKSTLFKGWETTTTDDKFLLTARTCFSHTRIGNFVNFGH